MHRLKNIIEKSDTVEGKVFDLFIQFFILLSLITFSIDTLPDLSDRSRFILRVLEVITVTVFSIEYLLRILVADKKACFVFSFFGIIDLLAILPFYLRLGIDLRSIRSVRMLRLFRMFKLVRYSRAIRRFHRAFTIVKEELVLFFFTTCILLYLSAAGIYFFENAAQPEAFKSVFHSLWWATITLTTVGYGDIYPVTIGGRIFTFVILMIGLGVTIGGRIFTFVILMIGLGIVAVPTGLMASALSKAREEE
jgi:voltage-gated potassium channel